MPTITREKNKKKGLRPYYQKPHTSPTGKVTGGFWFAEIKDVRGKISRYRLGVRESERSNEGEAAAWDALRDLRKELLAAHPTTGSPVTIQQTCNERLNWLRSNRRQSTYDTALPILSDFCGSYGSEPICDLTEKKVNKWLDAHPQWGDGSRAKAVMIIEAAINSVCERHPNDPKGVVRLGWIEVNPIRNMDRPIIQARRIYYTSRHQKAILAAADDNFRILLWLCLRTGARAWSEIAKVTAKHCHEVHGNLVWRFAADEHKTGGRTKKGKTVYLPTDVQDWCRKAMKDHPEGPLVRNKWGRAYNDKTGYRNWARTIAKVKVELPENACVHAFRDTFVTEALAAGKSMDVIAELIQDDVTTLRRYYGHLELHTQALVDHVRSLGNCPTK